MLPQRSCVLPQRSGMLPQRLGVQRSSVLPQGSGVLPTCTQVSCAQSQSFLPDLFPPQSHRRPELGLAAVNFKPKALILQLTKPRLKKVPYFTEAHPASFFTSTSSNSHTLTCTWVSWECSYCGIQQAPMR